MLFYLVVALWVSPARFHRKDQPALKNNTLKIFIIVQEEFNKLVTHDLAGLDNYVIIYAWPIGAPFSFEACGEKYITEEIIIHIWIKGRNGRLWFIGLRLEEKKSHNVSRNKQEL